MEQSSSSKIVTLDRWKKPTPDDEPSIPMTHWCYGEEGNEHMSFKWAIHYHPSKGIFYVCLGCGSTVLPEQLASDNEPEED